MGAIGGGGDGACAVVRGVSLGFAVWGGCGGEGTRGGKIGTQVVEEGGVLGGGGAEAGLMPWVMTCGCSADVGCCAVCIQIFVI